jgi:hypothetical protein
VFLEEMAADLIQLLTMEVKELAALLALQVEARFSGSMAVLSHVFKASGTVTVYYVFIDDPFVHQTFKSAVYRSLSNVGAAGPEMLADVAGGDVTAFYSLEIVDQNISLGCLVF